MAKAKSKSKSKVCFEGVMAALPTPLEDNGEIKVKTVKKLIDHLLDEGLYGFYVTGATGEGACLSAKKREVMVNAAIEANAGRGKMIIHIGSIDPYEAMELTRQATKAGADGVSAVPPNYMFEYDADEICEYYTRLAGETDLPLLMYATQKTVALDVNGIIERLLAVPNIIGAKDTRANYYKMWQLKQLNGGDVNVINGPDETLICGLMMGADGGIGSTYNVMPRWFSELYKAFRAGKIDEARAIQTKINYGIQALLRLGRGNTVRSVKAALTLQGFDMGPAVYPAGHCSADEMKYIKKELKKVGVL